MTTVLETCGSPTIEPPVAIIDSNVMLEASSCVDMVKLYEASHVDPRGRDAIVRRQRARESLLLSVYLDAIKATTFSLFESVRIAMREIDPAETGAFENHAMRIWVHYVKDNVLPDWVITCPANGEEEPTGNGADTLLVEHAKRYGVPLISHEGVTAKGVDPKSGIRKKAKRAGVEVLTPREFYGDMDELLHSAVFLQRYDNGAEAHVRATSHPEILRDSMLWLRGYYRHIPYGVTVEGAPLPVRLPDHG